MSEANGTERSFNDRSLTINYLLDNEHVISKAEQDLLEMKATQYIIEKNRIENEGREQYLAVSPVHSLSFICCLYQ